MRLSGRVALVTGAQQGIGRAIAIALGRDGADVCVNFLDDRGAAERVAAEIRTHGGKAMIVAGDVARSRDVAAILAATIAELGPPDILVNNAGVFPRAPFLELAEAEWDHVLGVNLKGGFLCAQAAARAMVAAGKPGAIVNISSSAIRGDPRGVHYSASKAGVLGMTRAMALALAPHRIRVNAIAPGLTDTAAAPLRQHRGADRGARAGDPARPHGPARGDRAGRRLPRLRDAVFITGELIHANGGAYLA